MPASLAANNLLIAYCSVSANVAISLSGTGWTLGGSVAGAQSMAWAWALYGSQTSPTFSWTGSVRCVGQILQFTGNQTASPVGQSQTNSGTGTTASLTGITTTANNAFLWGNITTATNQTIPGPVPYTNLGVAANTPSAVSFTGTVGVSGATAQAPSVAISSSAWAGVSVEIVGSGVALTGNVRDTGVNQQILEKYAGPTNLRATSVNQQVLEKYAGPTNLRSTGVNFQVLRTQAIFIYTPPQPGASAASAQSAQTVPAQRISDRYVGFNATVKSAGQLNPGGKGPPGGPPGKNKGGAATIWVVHHLAIAKLRKNTRYMPDARVFATPDSVNYVPAQVPPPFIWRDRKQIVTIGPSRSVRTDHA
jgi:hypothetical protein